MALVDRFVASGGNFKATVAYSGAAYLKAFRRHASKGNRKASRKLKTFARRKVNRKWKPGDESSLPGEPPKRRSGTGRLAIESRWQGKSRDGIKRATTYASRTKALYMSQYEYGPVSMRRPWLGPALVENKRELAQIQISELKKLHRRSSIARL